MVEKYKHKKYKCPYCGETDTILFCCECARKHFYEKGYAQGYKDCEIDKAKKNARNN